MEENSGGLVASSVLSDTASASALRVCVSALEVVILIMMTATDVGDNQKTRRREQRDRMVLTCKCRVDHGFN